MNSSITLRIAKYNDFDGIGASWRSLILTSAECFSQLFHGTGNLLAVRKRHLSLRMSEIRGVLECLVDIDYRTV